MNDSDREKLDVEKRRQILQKKIEGYRSEAFDHEMTAFAAGKAEAGSDDANRQVDQQARQQRQQARVKYQMAATLEERLEELPEPEDGEDENEGDGG